MMGNLQERLTDGINGTPAMGESGRETCAELCTEMVADPRLPCRIRGQALRARLKTTVSSLPRIPFSSAL
ncbi:hypothetical protein C6A85_24815, partial [Mycobacterium sp. ITM-2017-0098]